MSCTVNLDFAIISLGLDGLCGTPFIELPRSDERKVDQVAV